MTEASDKTDSGDHDTSSDDDGLLQDSHVDEENPTQRNKQRASEDQEYIPVIIKRTDETRRHPDDSLDNAIEEGLEQLKRPAISLGLSAIAAGMIVGFSALAGAVVLTAMLEMQISGIVARLASAFAYPLGFVVCIMSGAQLFTEHTATAFYPVLDKKASLFRLARLWAIVIFGNLLGAGVCATLLCLADEVVGAKEGYLMSGHHLIEYSNMGIFTSAILAGWLMALGAWLATSSPRAISQIVEIYIVTFMIGVGGLHHSIAGSVELFAAMFMDSDQFSTSMVSRVVSIALVGNLVGGTLFVALLNYGHIRRTND